VINSWLVAPSSGVKVDSRCDVIAGGRAGVAAVDCVGELLGSTWPAVAPNPTGSCCCHTPGNTTLQDPPRRWAEPENVDPLCCEVPVDFPAVDVLVAPQSPCWHYKPSLTFLLNLWHFNIIRICSSWLLRKFWVQSTNRWRSSYMIWAAGSLLSIRRDNSSSKTLYRSAEIQRYFARVIWDDDELDL